MVKISSFLIGVTSLEKSKHFYEKILGMTFNEFRPPFASAELDGFEFNIEENAEYRTKDWAKRYIGGRKHISFQVENLEDFMKKASDLGANLVSTIETKSWGWKEAIISDRDGNEYIIEQKI